MSILHSAKLYANGSAAQSYIPPDVVRDHGFPLEIGKNVIVQLVPHRAVVLLPGAKPTEYPFDVTHPQRVDPRIDVSDFPIDDIDPDAALSDFERGDP